MALFVTGIVVPDAQDYTFWSIGLGVPALFAAAIMGKMNRLRAVSGSARIIEAGRRDKRHVSPSGRVDRIGNYGKWRACTSLRSPATANKRHQAQQFVDKLLAQRDVMIQPYIPAFATVGERSLVWIDGDFTHAVTKLPRFAGGHEQVSAAHAIDRRDQQLATCALDSIPFSEPLLYARVDVITDQGRPVVSELELIEPSLFLAQSASALRRFVDAVHREFRAVRLGVAPGA